MNATVIAPQKGDRITAAWGAAVAGAVNELVPFAVAHGLVRQGATGNGSEPLPANRRDRPAASTPGRYHLASATVTPANGNNAATAALTFANRYFRCGGKTYEGSTETVSGVELPAIVALKISLTGTAPVDTIEGYATLSDLKADEANNDYFTTPLYKLNAAGKIECDFRLGPDASQWEFSS